MGLIITKRGDNMALTDKEQGYDLKELTDLRNRKVKAQKILDTLNYEDTYKPSKDSHGKVKKTDAGVVIEAIDKKSELRVFLEAIGVGNTAKQDVIRKTKKAQSALSTDLIMIDAVIAQKKSLAG